MEMSVMTMQVPKELKTKIRIAAATKDWSMQCEAVARLEASFGDDAGAPAEPCRDADAEANKEGEGREGGQE